MSTARGTELTVATWNVCLGTDFEPILGAGRGTTLVDAAAEVLDGVRATRFPDRAAAIARVVARHRPDVLALQELGRWETGGGAEGHALYSFPDIVQEALARAGAPYVQVTCVDTVTGQLPVDGRAWARFTSCDALLVRKDADVDLSVVDVDEGHYVNAHSLELAGGSTTLPIRRGWSAAELERGGRRLRVVVTHLDSLDAQVRRAQVHELVSLACRSREPVVILGDLNSPASRVPDPSLSSSSSEDGVLEVLAGAGFADAWALCSQREHTRALGQRKPDGAVTTGSSASSELDGGTWGPAPGLRAPHSGASRKAELSQRLDYVFFDPLVLEARMASVIGVGEHDVTTTVPALLPSDHAGVLVRLRFRDEHGVSSD